MIAISAPHALLAAAIVVASAGPAAARQVSTVRSIVLATPDGVAAEPFSLIRGAVELSDGRLLVTDWIEQRLAIIDFARKTVEDRGRVGAGPGEFRLPGPLFRFRADSVLLADIGNARLAVLSPDGRIRRSFQPPDPAAASPLGTDGGGRIYYSVPPWRARPALPGDSVEVKVLEPSGTSRAVARLHGSTTVPGPSMKPRVPFVIFAAQDGFTVSTAGRIAIVRDGDYSVHWHAEAGAVAGPPNPSAALRPSEEDRIAFVRQFVLSSPMSGRGEDGGLGHTPAEFATDPAVREMMKASTFAERLPPFRAGDVRSDGRGRLWVGRFDHEKDPRRYDVFDDAGRRMAEVRLAPDRRIVALGAAYAYVVHTDENGLQTVERHALAALGTNR
jgi:hypothetical protein